MGVGAECKHSKSVPMVQDPITTLPRGVVPVDGNGRSVTVVHSILKASLLVMVVLRSM